MLSILSSTYYKRFSPYYKFLLAVFLLAALFLQSCNKPTEPPEPPQPPPPPPPVVKPTLILELDDAHCTETWILLSTKDLQLPAELLLKQYKPNGDSITQNINVTTKDTLLYIDSLYPSQTYRYQVSGIWYPKVDSQQVVTSNEITVLTMDTTSSSFTFEMITFGGEIGSSVLYDVAIINENNIWAVGDIWRKDDTSSLGYTKYNAVHWDGNSWDFKRIRTNSCGGVDYPPIKTLFGFSADNILFAHIDGSITHFNGIEFINDCSLINQLNGSANKIWGLSKDDYYVVSGNGFIAHYNGVNWKKLASGTTLNINDIWGDYNPKTNEWEILAVGGNILAGHGNILLQIKKNNSIEKVSSENANWPLRSLWFISNKNYYISGSGIYQKHYLDEKGWKNDIFLITTYSTNRIRGQKINDIVATGGAGELLHFNGSSWKSFIDVVGIPGNYYGTAIFNNIIVIVGQSSNMAVLSIGRR